MIRLLVLIFVLLLLVYLLDRAFVRLLRRLRRPGTTPGAAGAPPTSTPAELTACPTCGIHFLPERGRRHGHQLYCSERCAGGG